jgi:hypothetical protein
MRKQFFVSLGAFLSLLLLTSWAADNKTVQVSPSPTAREIPSPSPSAAKQSANLTSFHGMVAAIDQKARTFTLAGKQPSRVFQVTGKTVITKSGNAANMADMSESEEVSGSFFKKADGTLEAKIVRLGSLKKEGAPGKKRDGTPATTTSATPTPKDLPRQ